MGITTTNISENITQDLEQWDTEIKPRGGLLDVDFKEIWRYRDLLQMFIKRDIITQYKQTILGPIWFFLQPILSTAMFYVVFTKFAKIPTDGIPPILFYLAGICLWNYFSDCLNKTSNTFTANAAIFGKVYFPRLIVPISIVMSNLIRFVIQLLLFVLIYIYYIFFENYQINIDISVLLVPVLILMMSGIALGSGILVSSLTTKYRDLTVLFSFVVQLWMYATPIILPLSFVEKDKQWIMLLNPITSIVETFKYSVFGQGTFNVWQLLYSFGFMVVLMALGIVVFNRVQRSFMDTV